MRPITNEDLAYARRLARRWAFKRHIDDAIGEAYLGLVEAAIESQGSRSSWPDLRRWRIADRVRQGVTRRAMWWELSGEPLLGPAHDVVLMHDAKSVDEPSDLDWRQEVALAWYECVTGRVRREVTRLAWIEGLSAEEIAMRTSIPINTVYSHVHQARLQVLEFVRARLVAPVSAGDLMASAAVEPRRLSAAAG